MWELYDRLIAGVDPQRTVECAGYGCWRAYVESQGRVGLATLMASDQQAPEPRGELAAWAGRPLRELAALCKSWNEREAALGVAALNAYYNDSARLRAAGARLYTPGSGEGDAFALLQPQAAGKKVATVGHFKEVGDAYRHLCDFTVFEREPRPGDLPDTAEEYLLPEMDLVFITAMALTNKTLPRLLQLTAAGRTVITGPSLPLCSLFFEYGADVLSGLVVTDPAAVRQAVFSSDWRQVFAVSPKVIWERQRQR